LAGEPWSAFAALARMNATPQRQAPAAPIWRVVLRGAIPLALHRLRFRGRVDRFARIVEAHVTTRLEEPTGAAANPPLPAGLPEGGPPSVSVIVNTVDRADLLSRLLRSLEALRYLNFEVVVVVGPSSDHTRAVLEAWAGRVKLRDCPTDNLALSRNIGLAAASGEIAAFIDDDSVAEADWLDRLVAPMRDRGVVAAGGPIRDRTGVSFQAGALETNRLAITRPTDTPDVPIGRDSDWRLSLTGTNFCLRIAPALAAGGFDERFSYFLEETDLQRRLVDLGGRVAFAPDAEVHHAFAASARRKADRVPTDFTTILASLVIFCRKFARGPEWRRTIAERVGRRLAEIEARLILLQARGLIDRRRARALLRSALRGVARGAATRPAAVTPIPRENPGEGFLRLRARQRRALRIALAGGADPLERDALEALASELARSGHEATVILPSREAASVEFVDGYWRHFTRRRGGAGLVSHAAPDVGEWILAEMARVAPRRLFEALVVPGDGAEPAVCYAVEADGAPGSPPIAKLDFGAAESVAARAAAIVAALSRDARLGS
jgi:GT2 family glycosyltransferase